MKKNVINSLLADSSTLLTYLNNSDDLLVMSLFIKMLCDLKKDIIRDEEILKESEAII